MIEAIPYGLLWAAIFFAWTTTIRSSLFALGLAVISGLGLGRLNYLAVPAIVVLGLSLWLATRTHKPAVKVLGHLVFLGLAVAMLVHQVPGFVNLPIYKGVQFSADSAPFTMYLNFDKTMVGLFIYLFLLKPDPDAAPATYKFLWPTIALWIALILVFLPLTLLMGYVRYDYKVPEQSWLWMANNLFFVCLAEEAFFRGYVQRYLGERIGAWPAIATAAVLFGLAHISGGFSYVFLAALAGLFYGFAFQRTQRIESAMLVHFGLNAVHFLFFTYPSLIT